LEKVKVISLSRAISIHGGHQQLTCAQFAGTLDPRQRVEAGSATTSMGKNFKIFTTSTDIDGDHDALSSKF
jgi:hypothetical protein